MADNTDTKKWGSSEWIQAWKQSKDDWVVPPATPFMISTCTVGVKLGPIISFPEMANWLLQRRPWERVRNNSNILVKMDILADAHIEGFLFWNPKKLTRCCTQKQVVPRGDYSGSEQPQLSVVGHIADDANDDNHQTLPNYFYNSVTIYVNLGVGRKRINLKYFLNGSMTLTGCSSMQDAKDAVAIWQKMLQERPEWREIPETTFEVIQDFKFNMINAYFSVGFSIDCMKVYEFCRDKLKLFVNYDPKQYQGVIVYYMWNRKQENHTGICACNGEYSCSFSGKRRRGEGEGDCVKLTFIIFSTGNILITGGISIEQITDCYHFFTSNFRQYATSIVQFSLKDFTSLQSPNEVKHRKHKSKSIVKQSENIRLTTYWPQEQK